MLDKKAMEWLNRNQLSYDIWNNKYRWNNESFDEWLDRVSNKDEDIKRLIVEKKFLFGGRTLSNRGTENGSSFSNCYSSGYAEDSVEGMMELSKRIALTYKSEGGQGISMSKVRPKDSPVGKHGFTSDGIIPFMEVFNQVTSSISQGGSRKGALMLSLDVWHKEIEEFINIKSNSDRINKANLSVEVDDKFMRHIKRHYDGVENTIIDNEFMCENGEIIRYKVDPINIYKKMMYMAWDNAEPGIIYTNRFRSYNLMEKIEDYNIITGNPCGEQPLPKDGACNLGSINLSEFVDDPFTEYSTFNLEEFRKAIRVAIKGLDSVITDGMELHALKEQREVARNYRNTGLGIMGLGDMFFKLGIKYGSKESKEILDVIMKEMFREAVISSNELAKELGRFPSYNDLVFDSEIIKKHFDDDEIEKLRIDGIRNCSLLSVAPSGSIGSLLNVTNGVEPAYLISYNRKTESLHKDKEVEYKVFIESAKEYMNLKQTDILPEYFITSMEINWKDRIDIQSIIQEHTDTAISSTVNLKNEATLEEVERLYLYAWEKGLKGVTIFRDGCNRSQILFGDKKEEGKELELERGVMSEVPDDTYYIPKKITHGCGEMKVMIGYSPSKSSVVDVYVIPKSSSGCTKNITGEAILISQVLRLGGDLRDIKDSIKGVEACTSCMASRMRGRDVDGVNCPNILIDAVISVQDKMNGKEEIVREIPRESVKPQAKIEIDNKVICPECGEELYPTGSCWQCPSCAFSRCE